MLISKSSSLLPVILWVYRCFKWCFPELISR
jgi:hypothetical protein